MPPIFGVMVTPIDILAVLLSTLAVGLDVTAYIKYNIDLFQGKGNPSKVLWFVWIIIAGLNAASYLVVSGDKVKTALAIENTIACVITFGFAFKYGEVKPLEPNEKRVLWIGILAGATWWIFHEALYANILLQIGTIVAFWPFYLKVWNKPLSEPRAPWLIWTVGYVVNFGVVMVRWHGAWGDLLYPILYIVLHLAVFLITFRRIPIPQAPSAPEEPT